MKISSIKIKNYLGIEEQDITFNKDKVFITGGNGRGKTSVLEAIENTVNSTSDRRPKKVTDGKDAAILLLELDDGTEIKRTITTEGENKVEVKKDGMKISKPETFLKGIMGGFAFNPVDFLQKKDKEQAEILLNLIPFEITPAECEKWFGEIPGINYKQHGLKALNELAEKYFYNKRAVANSEVKQFENQIEAVNRQLPDNYKAEEWESINLSDIYTEVEKKKAKNDKLDRAKKIVEEYAEKVKTVEMKYEILASDTEKEKQAEFKVLDKMVLDRKQVLEKEIDVLKAEIEDYLKLIEVRKEQIKLKQGRIETYDTEYKASEEKTIEANYKGKFALLENKKQTELNELSGTYNAAFNFAEVNQYEDTSPLMQKACEVEKMKGFIQLYNNMKAHEKNLKSKIETAQKYDSFVDFCRRKPQEILQNMKMPVENLGLDSEGNITINNRPIKNLSTAEQLDTAIDIARATAGELRIICIDKFETMDEDMQAQFMSRTENDGFTYIITKVTKGDLRVEAI